MTGPVDPRRHLLTDEESQRVFVEDIVPDELAHGEPQAEPTVVFVAGQPRVDTVIETTMRDPGDFAEPARMFRAAGYRVEAVIMAVPEAQSRLGIVDRYQSQVEQAGHGRLTARDNHDASYRGVLEAARAIDEVHRAAEAIRRARHTVEAPSSAGDGPGAPAPDAGRPEAGAGR
ncbi:zeta toxin family protein [Dactylosporangium sp. NPDC005555]|uniref:zeta toxin family protein n=1 Tax=Dactylosporangium sp. NPDC005555 TaxID=3154889 RepID=UPI0033A57104